MRIVMIQLHPLMQVGSPTTTLSVGVAGSANGAESRRGNAFWDDEDEE